jgi:DNA-binding IclR family transcriptional regulator
METNRESGVGVLDKAVVVLDAVASEPRSLADLVAATGLPRATAHRLAAALETHGFVRRDELGRYVLGLRLAALGRAAQQAFPLAAIARPVLEALRDRTGESVQLYVAEAGGRRCVVSYESTHGLRWIVPEGALLPIDKGSAGRALGNDVTRNGWSESVEEREKGVCSVSAPVIDSTGTVVAAVSLSGPLERLGRQPARRFGESVLAAANALALRLP